MKIDMYRKEKFSDDELKEMLETVKDEEAKYTRDLRVSDMPPFRAKKGSGLHNGSNSYSSKTTQDSYTGTPEAPATTTAPLFSYERVYPKEYDMVSPDDKLVYSGRKFEFKEVPLGIKISIGGTLYSLEEAEKLYLELDKIFASSKQFEEATLEERDYMPIWRVPTYEEAGRVRGWRGVVSTTTAVGGDTKEVTTDTDKAMPIDGGIRISYHSDKASPRRKTSTGCYPPRRGKHRQ